MTAPEVKKSNVRDLVSKGKRIVRVVPDRRSLEEVYLSLVGADS